MNICDQQADFCEGSYRVTSFNIKEDVYDVMKEREYQM